MIKENDLYLQRFIRNYTLWKDIECYNSKVPAGVVPEQIAAYLNKNYSGKSVIKFERHRSVYEVKLNNGMEIEFNRNYQVIDVDFDD